MFGNFISRRLSAKLLLMTIGFVMLAELIIFVPSATLFRQDWLAERADKAGLLAQALVGIPDFMASEPLNKQFMKDTDVELVSVKRDGMTELLLGAPPENIDPMALIDLREERGFPLYRDTFRDFFGAADGTYRVITTSPVAGQETLELILPRKALQRDLRDYFRRIFWLSLAIAVITGALIYFALSALIIMPVKRLAADMTRFRENPQLRRVNRPKLRRIDEIGQLDREFVDVKQSLRAAFRQRERLAGLGLAVAKINHDLRNVLTTALLISDRLSMQKDANVADMGEKLTRTVERGVALTEEVLAFSKAETMDPEPQNVRLSFLVGEAAADVLEQFPDTQFRNSIPTEFMVRTDPDHVYRIFHNLFRNAAQAMASQEGPRELAVSSDIDGSWANVTISDTGPGLPKRAKENLFQAFSSAHPHSAGQKSTGLGLSISKELAVAQGGDLTLLASDVSGTQFQLQLPLGT